MDYTRRETARRIVADVLKTRPPADGQFRMFAVDPETLLGPERMEAARQWASMVPAGTTLENCERVVEMVAAMLNVTADNPLPPGGLQTGHHVPTVRATH